MRNSIREGLEVEMDATEDKRERVLEEQMEAPEEKKEGVWKRE
jgi:hypothetical protein